MADKTVVVQLGVADLLEGLLIKSCTFMGGVIDRTDLRYQDQIRQTTLLFQSGR
jgi:hypothetical protein